MGRFFSVSFGLLVVFLSLSETGADQDCLPDWSFYEGRCYKVFSRQMTWADAEKFCNRWDGGHLVSIESNGKAEFVAQLVSENLRERQYVWIGLRDHSETQHCSELWPDGSFISYENVIYPTKCFALEKQTEFRNWVPFRCGSRLPFVCKSLIPR
uniref:C-type lectin K n=1 Tax=Echis coloratus TaxID=64175 RepID=A0A0A1WCL8_ECHCO